MYIRLLPDLPVTIIPSWQCTATTTKILHSTVINMIWYCAVAVAVLWSKRKSYPLFIVYHAFAIVRYYSIKRKHQNALWDFHFLLLLLRPMAPQNTDHRPQTAPNKSVN